ncbi:unnamed protein product [Triticum turgidum subsp. durum]|uniref:UDP-glucuronate decarboxylase n=1 Tax=Triticum turgidum subsp. durum TaxID=4567 RepID=A0A9R1PF90_TRITD|nr:unnamed protein product [Triticum turgidum subsp. durum]
MASSELTYRGQQAAAADGAHGPAESKPRTRQQLPQPLRYVLGEQRLVFSLVGMALATLVFLLLSPSTTTTTSSSSSVAHLAAVGLVSRQYQSGGAGRMAFEEGTGGVRHGRVPLGLKRKGLRVVVTGGAGFVGSHLVDRLLARGDSVIVVDNFFTGRKENVAHHAGNPNFEMIRHDVVEPILLEVDQIYHLACPASPVHYKFNPANLEVRIARIFNTYGPRMCIDDGRVVSNFVAQALRKEPLTVYGDGKQTRSFQYVSDLVEGLMKLMEGEHVGPFNLGNPGEFTMLELAKVVQDTIDPNARIEFRANTADDPHKRKPDITKAKELLGWEPKVALRNGLPLMVQDFRTRIFGDQKQQQPDGSE